MGKEVHITVALLSLIADLALIIPFYLNRKHYLVNYNGFKHIVLNTNMLRNVDLYGINYIACFCDILKENNQELTLCDKSHIWQNIFGANIPSISSELEAINA